MIDAMEHRHEHYNEELEYIRGKEERGELFVIRPPKKIEVSKVERDRQRLLAAYRNQTDQDAPGYHDNVWDGRR